MERSMQQVQSENDKMVPIDTSGDSVEVELKEEQKEQQKEQKVDAPDIQVEQEQQPPAKETTSEKEEELEEYSAGVKRRIDKLTRKMREAERREQAALDYAKNIKSKFDSLEQTNFIQSETSLADREKALASQKEFAKRALEAAINAQDVEKQVAAQQEIGRLTIEDERLKVSKAKIAQRKTEQESKEKEVPIEEEVYGQQTQNTAPPDPKAQEWAEKNTWFGTDGPMTYTAYDIHKNLMEEGFDAKSDEYYTEIDRRIRKEFPHKFGDQNRPKQKVASAVRTTSTGRRTVKLTPSQVAIAKKLGVPLEEYAKHVKEA